MYEHAYLWRHRSRTARAGRGEQPPIRAVGPVRKATPPVADDVVALGAASEPPAFLARRCIERNQVTRRRCGVVEHAIDNQVVGLELAPADAPDAARRRGVR